MAIALKRERIPRLVRDAKRGRKYRLEWEIRRRDGWRVKLAARSPISRRRSSTRDLRFPDAADIGRYRDDNMVFASFFFVSI